MLGGGTIGIWDEQIASSPRPSDSLAPARSARSGPLPLANSFRRFPSGSSPPEREERGFFSLPCFPRAALVPRLPWAGSYFEDVTPTTSRTDLHGFGWNGLSAFGILPHRFFNLSALLLMNL